DAVIQPFRNEAPLHRHVADTSAGRQIFVRTPGRRAMIQYHVITAASHTERVLLLPGTNSWAAPQISHDHVVRPDAEFTVTQTNPLPRSYLPGNSRERFADPNLLFQIDYPGNTKNHNPWPLGFTSGPQAPRT